MSQANYRTIGGPNGLLARKATFEGNSMSACTTDDNVTYLGTRRAPETAPVYRVFSYATEIATVRDGVVSVIDNRWGPTTARHINLCKAWL